MYMKLCCVPEQSRFQGAVVYMKLYCIPEQSRFQGAVVYMKSAFVEVLRVHFPLWFILPYIILEPFKLLSLEILPSKSCIF